MTSETFPPLLTSEIPPPIIDPGIGDDREGPLPRSLAQAAGKTRARGRMLLVLAVLLVQIALEAILLRRLSAGAALVVYLSGPDARRSAR